MLVIPEQPLKQSLPILVTLAGKNTDLIDVQFWKALPPISVIKLGISKLKEEQPLNIVPGILVSWLGQTTLSSPLQFWKTEVPIEVTVVGIANVSNAVQPMNAWLPMVLILAPSKNVMVVNEVLY